MNDFKTRNYTIEFWFLLLIVAGYLVFSAFAKPLQIENSRIFAVPYRVLIFVMSLYLIYKNFSWQRFKNISIISFLAFWVFYTLKAVWSFNNFTFANEILADWNEIYVRIVLIVVAPSVALMSLDYSKVNFKALTRLIIYIFSFFLTINLFYGIIMYQGDLRLPYMFSVYYISYGHFGASLILISLFYLLFIKEKILPDWFLYFALTIGGISLFIGTARSPFVGVVLGSLFLILAKKNFKLLLAFFLIVIASIIGIWWYVQLGFKDFAFITRTYAWIFEGDNSLRTPLFENSIKIFKESPLFGGRILYEDGTYPHNIFLELLMATGIIGLLIYGLKFIPLVKNFNIFINQNRNIYYLLYFALFIQYFGLVLTSFNLYSVPEFVHFSAIVIGIALHRIYEIAMNMSANKH